MTAVPQSAQPQQNSEVASTPAPATEAAPVEAVESQPVMAHHPLMEPLLEAISLKSAKEYVAADNLCWELLADYEISQQTYADIPNADLVKLIPAEDRRMVAQIVYELGLSGEARLRVAGDRENDKSDRLTGQAIKFYLLAGDLDPHFAPAAFHLASVVTHMKPHDLQNQRWEFDLPLLDAKVDPGKVLTDFQEQCLVRLVVAVDSPPYDIRDGHFTGETPLPASMKFKLPADPNSPDFNDINDLTWMLSDAAKLSINIANYFRHTPSGDNSSMATHLGMTRDFAGTLLNMFDIPREQTAARSKIERIKDTLGVKGKTVVSALTNLASAAQMEGQLPLAREWYKTALLIEPGNSFATERLAALADSKRFDPRTVNVLISNLAAENKPAAPVAREWQENFETLKVGSLHGEIVASIQREKITQQHPEIIDAATEAAKVLRVIFGAKGEVPHSYLSYLGKAETQEAFWGIGFEADGLLTIQAHISILQLCIERNLLEDSKHLQDIKEKLGEIVGTFADSFNFPSQEDQYPFYQQVLNWVITDLNKKR